MYILPIQFHQLNSDAEAAKSQVEKLLPDMVDGSDFANYAVIDAIPNGDTLYDDDANKLRGYVVTVEFAVFANDVDHANAAADYTAANIFGDSTLSGYEIMPAYSDGLNEQEDGSLA